VIIFVTGQYAGAQYIHPLLKRWAIDGKQCPEYKLVATGGSVKYWQEVKVKYDQVLTSTIMEYIKTVNPKLIILSASGNENLEYLFILAAKKLSIKTINFIDIWGNYRNRYIYNGEEVFPDVILSINEKCTEEMVSEGVPAEIIQEIGQPYLEDICENIPPLGDEILIPMQPIKQARGSSLGYNEKDFLNLTLSVLKQVGKISEAHITAHPSDNFNLLNQSTVRLTEGRGIEDIKDSHTVLGMFSMQMIVGYLYGRKVASIQPKLKGMDPSPLSRWGLIPTIRSKKELVNFLNLKTDSGTSQKSVLFQQLHGSLNRLDHFVRKDYFV